MPHRLHLGFGILLFAASAAALASPFADPPSSPAATTNLTDVRFWTLSDSTRVVIEISSDFQYRQDRVPDPDRIFFDFRGTSVRLTGGKRHAAIPVSDPRLKQIRIAETQPGVARVVFDLEPGVDFSASRLTNPSRLIVEIRAASAAPKLTQPPESPAPRTFAPPPTATKVRPVLTVDGAPQVSARRGTPAQVAAIPSTRPKLPPPPSETAAPNLTSDMAPRLPARTAAAKIPPPPKPARVDGSQSMTRVLGLKVGRIVLDAGHGGHDTGTIGPNGLYEKDLVLDVAKRLAVLIESRLGAEVVFTRQDDTFISLDRRPEIANEQKADLFLSIHANSSPLAITSGVETYYLNFTDSKPALELAARENAGSSRTVSDLRDLVQKIALHDKIEESRQFAARIQASLQAASLKANPRSKDRGVRKAPFVVLIGAQMPSVLAEIGFVTNPKDETLFRKQDYRQSIAEGLYRGLARYAGTLSQFQVAQN
ncbi:MAG: N-acetylmuramoyl-L-alanine amidase [Bryobacteraceae bacterium]|nr:N-acetylmuramoyl-L-alanine amidase [Bryobacteraceae bacterium]